MGAPVHTEEGDSSRDIGSKMLQEAAGCRRMPQEEAGGGTATSAGVQGGTAPQQGSKGGTAPLCHTLLPLGNLICGACSLPSLAKPGVYGTGGHHAKNSRMSFL